MAYNQNEYLSGPCNGNPYYGGNPVSNNSQLFEFSLQEMIDSDMKTEFDDISCDFGGAVTSSGVFGGISNLDLLDDLDFNFDEGLLHTQDWSMGAGSNPGNHQHGHSSMFSSQPLRGSSLYHDDSMGGLIVNPSSVMPIQQHQQQSQMKNQSIIRPLSISTHNNSGVLSNTPSPISLALHLPHHHQHHDQAQHQQHLRQDIKILKISPSMSSPPQQVPSPHMMIGQHTPTSVSSTTVSLASQSGLKKKVTLSQQQQQHAENIFPKPAYSYSCLIALSLKNSRTGSLSVSEIYKFMCDHFPYFKTAPSGWKNSVRHNLSLNKCFEKVEKPSTTGNQRKGCLWKMNPAKVTKMEEEVAKWSRKDRMGIKKGMVCPENLEALERGELIRDYSGGMGGSSIGADSEDEEDPKTPHSVSSQGSHGTADPSSGGDIVDIEHFSSLQPDSTFSEMNLPTPSGLFDELESTNPTFFHANYSIASLGTSNNHSNEKVYNMLILNRGDGLRQIVNMDR